MNTHPNYFDDKKTQTQRMEKGGNPYVIGSFKDVFEIFHFGAFAFIALQLAAVVFFARFMQEWFELDSFVCGGLYLAYCLAVNAISFLTKFGLYYSVFLHAALRVALLTILPVGLVEVGHRLVHLVQV